jgi:uncharacterized protein (TIGR02118 family)
MFKAMFFLYRRTDLTPEQFQEYSRETHMPLVSRVPGLKQYVVNHTAMNPSGVESACDAVAELWFDSPEAFQTALGSPEGGAAIGDQPNYLDMARTHVLFVEEISGL